MKSYDYVAWQSEGIWTAHSPSVPGVYGVGKTRAEAAADLGAGLSDMLDHLREIGEPLPRAGSVNVGVVNVQIQI